MQRFQFRLERVKDWRQKQVEIEEQKLRKLFAERQALDQDFARLEAGRADAERQVLHSQAVEARDLVALESYRLYVSSRQQILRNRMRDCDGRIGAQRRQVMEAERRFRLLERLKAKRFTEWQKQFDLELESLASEVFLSQWRPA